MPDQPIRDPRILEAIEACRPGSRDLEDPGLAFLAAQLAADPELRDLFHRLEHLDATLAHAFRDVPVPEGLAKRITARLASVRNGHGTPAERVARASCPCSPATGRAPVQPPVAKVGKSRRRVSRRWLLAGAGGAVVAASLAVACLVRRPGPVVRRQQEVFSGAIEFFDGDWDQAGELIAQSPPPGDYLPGPDFDLSKFPQVRWRRIADFLGCEGVAYDITRPGAARATLYVVNCTVPDLLDTEPPLAPLRTTGNRAVGAWQTGGLLYVLVVEGERRTYQRFVPSRTWT